MKTLIAAIALALITFNSIACTQRKPVEISTPAQQIMTTDSEAVVALIDSIDSTRLDAETHGTALQQDPPPVKTITNVDCDVAFIPLSNPAKNHYIFQVNNFNPGNSKCWLQIEEHGRKHCGDNMPCEISYIEVSKITQTTNPPHYVDAAILKKYGIGYFVYRNSWWELKGANIWGRTGDFKFYNSNRY